ncbi:MAG: 5-(carboxyamino)imidazole ribonucleotide synthase [Rhizobiaceae bacterium]|nr:5-(carboxyamino)imidazole ribonucleotide synthase [Rhizobiaceae bacterium]
MTASLSPNSTIGIIGGGQLARMLASSAARLGFHTIVLEPGADCPAAQTCNRHIVAAYDDESALAELANACDVVTYEFENVPLSAADHLTSRVPLYPPAKALEVSQDRLLEKQFLQQAGLEVADFHNVEAPTDLVEALQQFGGGVLKTRRFGYDGKGQHVFASADVSVDEAQSVLEQLGTGPFVLERLIDFVSEFSVIAGRSTDGNTCAYDPSTNIHEAGILRRSTVPAALEDGLAQRACSMAVTLLDALDYVGVIGVEFFLANNGLLINEFAPRVHNSGHWTREACATSQFENHIRAISGHALGSVQRYHDCEMINLLGDEGTQIATYLSQQASQVTLYGKSEARPGRKMGHVTRLI